MENSGSNDGGVRIDNMSIKLWAPSITGVTTSNIISAEVHKRRLWLVEANSLKVWYLPVDSVGGAAKSFDLSATCKKGGYIMALATWTLDSGEGIDDALVAITSEGQVVVAKGTDPSSAATWGLVGVWNVGQPIGRRCLMKYRGDVLMILKDGVYALSSALIGSQTSPEQALTYKINQKMTESANLYSGNFGWELFHNPDRNMLLLNVPVGEGSKQEQYAMNTITGAWGQFKSISANCWALLDGQAYFGTDGEVVKYGSATYADNSANIDADLLQAYSYFGSKGRLKHHKMVRPNFLIGGQVTLLMDMNVDYENAWNSGGR